MRKRLVASGVAIVAGLCWATIVEGREVVAVHKHPTERDRARIYEAARREGNAVEVSDDSETLVVWRSQNEATCSAVVAPSAIQSGCASLSTTPTWSSTDAYAVGGLRWLDVNDDGYLDLVSAHYQGGFPTRPQETRIWLNRGGTLETTASWVSTDAVWSTDVAVGDIDGNGTPDLAIVNSSTSKIHFHDGNGIETTPSWASASTSWSLAGCLGSISGGPFLDLALANQTSEPNILYGNTTGIPSTAVTWSSSDAGENTACALGDYDEDGVSVVVVPMSGDGARKCFFLPTVPIHRVVQVTVNGVPVPDVSIHLRDGWAVFHSAPPAGTGNIEFTLEVSRDLDLAVSVRQGNAKVYRDIGATLETTPSFTVSGTGNQREKGVAWVDIDGDADLDLFVGGDDVPMQLFRNNAGALDPVAFWASADTSPDVADVDWIDMDNDGDPDLATANTTTTPVFRVYENVGGILAVAECWGIPWGGSQAQAVAWGDMDSDGWPDLAVAHAGAPIRVYRSQPAIGCDLMAVDIDTGPPPSPTLSSVYGSSCSGLGGASAYRAIVNPADPDELTPPASTDLVLYQLACPCAGAGIRLFKKDDVMPGNIGVDIF